MLRQYRKLVQEAGMVGTKRLGDKPHVDSARIWGKLISRLIQNEYTWDSGQLGNLEQFAVKVAYFFHASLQGCSAAPEAAETLGRLQAGGIRLGLLADTQSFTLPHLLKALWGSGKMQDASTVFSSGLMTTSHQTGVRTPSPTLYAWAVKHAAKSGLEPEQVLHVSHRLGEDLAVAKEFGFRTALYAGDRLCCQVTPEQLKDPEIRPDRLITNLAQLLDIVDA
jgi:FMN phosphatase YigB (HAD superfamily)